MVSFFYAHMPYSKAVKDPVVQEGSTVLRAIASAVAKKDIQSPKIKRVISRMKKVLAGEEYGVAIAAPQIGQGLRIFVVSGRAMLPEDALEDAVPPADLTFINPELSRLSRAKKEMSEGCLSVRGKYGTVLRHEKASVKALNEKGEAFTYNGTGLMAHIFQHEYDHLEGILYIDKAVRLTLDSKLNRKELRDAFPAGSKESADGHIEHE
jgi:peptide deformylase